MLGQKSSKGMGGEGELRGREDGTEARKGAVASLARSGTRRPRENRREINDLLIHATNSRERGSFFPSHVSSPSI